MQLPKDTSTSGPLRALLVPVFLPSTLYGIGQGVVAPLLVVAAREQGASLAVAGLVAALLGLGQVLGDLPAGRLVARWGERQALAGASVAAALAAVGCALAPGVTLLAFGVLLVGVANAIWGLARQAYVTDVVPTQLRGRALSTLGGTRRVGTFAGAFLGAGAVHFTGVGAAFLLQAALTAAAGAVAHFAASAKEQDPQRPSPVATSLVLRDNARTLRTLGFATLLVGAVRASRDVVVPLWGLHIGCDPAVIAVVVGLSGAADAALFYPSGVAMDRWGRRVVAAPAMAVLGLAHVLLTGVGGTGSLALVALLMGVANGMSAGVVMTLGADVAPTTGRAVFLGIWRLGHDIGNGVGPLVVSAGTGIASLGVGVGVMGGVSVAAAAALARWVPRRVNPGSG